MTTYAICENGGTTSERLRHERYDTKREALDAAYTLQEIEDVLSGWDVDDDEMWAAGLERTTFDVMRQLADGSWTTEC